MSLSLQCENPASAHMLPAPSGPLQPLHLERSTLLGKEAYRETKRVLLFCDSVSIAFPKSKVMFFSSFFPFVFFACSEMGGFGFF